ncbi:hypothetical protein [Orenia marismortui]|uniref:Uncharacterized protein n=1 Tax=Orenia marismortui TaxID=46469 RepID=A0A4R8H3L3_9FIRM|nr:hypothetical protein [Orenia marismortui]TDX49130.1 hypothetical protein C7959_12024 [Orenia marismortui]
MKHYQATSKRIKRNFDIKEFREIFEEEVMKLNLRGALKNIGKGYYEIIQVYKNGKTRVLENDENHLETFISNIRKGNLKEYEIMSDCKIRLKLSNDHVSDHWEVIPVIRLIQYQVSKYRRRVVDNDLINKQLGLCLLTHIKQAKKIHNIDIIEIVDYVDENKIEYILKDKFERQITKVELSNKLSRVI